MKSYVVYVKGHKQSEAYMQTCINSCIGTGFEAEAFEGVTPATLHNWDDYPDHPNSRISNFKQESDKIYKTKKSCFTNHVRIWKKCIELNEPVAFIEQDSYCVNNWNNVVFKDILILNVLSAFKQPVFEHVKKKPDLLTKLGVNIYNDSFLVYNRSNSPFNGGLMIPGTAAYAITPSGARKLLSALDKHGWEQSDLFINTRNVDMQYCVPEYFTFKFKNLNLSHGF